MARSLENGHGTQETLQLAVSAATPLSDACDLAGVSVTHRNVH